MTKQEKSNFKLCLISDILKDQKFLGYDADGQDFDKLYDKTENQLIDLCYVYSNEAIKRINKAQAL